MDAGSKFRIHVNIADVIYPMTIRREEEEVYRKTAAMINERINMYRERYPQGSKENHFAMVAFDFAFQVATANFRNDTKPYLEKLKELTAEVEKHLQKEQMDENAG